MIEANRRYRDALTSLTNGNRSLSEQNKDLLMEHMCFDSEFYKIELTRLLKSNTEI